VDFRHHGVRYRKRSPHNSKGAAREYENTLRLSLASGIGPFRDEPEPAQPAPPFAEFAELWFGQYVCANNKVSEIRAKRRILERHLLPWFTDVSLPAITSADIEAYKAAKISEGLMAKTVNNHLAVLGKMLRTAVDWNALPACPRYRMLRTAPPKMDYLDPLESHRLLSDHAEPKWHAMIHLALRTGMRLGEMRALAWCDMDFRRREITVRRSAIRTDIDTTKTYRTRYVPMTDDLFELLRAISHSSGLVFARNDEKVVPECTAARAIHRVCDRVGLRRVGWHTLRHTFASRLVSEGVPLNEVMLLMGHSCITTTMRYAHFAPSKLHESVRVLEAAELREKNRNLGQPVGNAPKVAAIARACA